MNKRSASMTVAALAGVVGLVGLAVAGDGSDVAVVVEKVAASLKKGDNDTARKLADAYAKKAEGVEDLMELYKRKDKGGIGFGAGPKALDGIEARIRELAAGRNADFAKYKALYEKLAQNTAAIGLVTEAMTPKQDKGAKTVKTWKSAAADAQVAANELAKAKTAKDATAAATKLNNACITCHAEWRK